MSRVAGIEAAQTLLDQIPSVRVICRCDRLLSGVRQRLLYLDEHHAPLDKPMS